MSTEAQRKQALERIKENIVRAGHHVYVVSGGAAPRLIYTIGVSESIGVELILAGATFYMKENALKVINDLICLLKPHHDRQTFEVDGEGSFALRKVHDSWATKLMLGASDYYQKPISAFQIVPDKNHSTIDVPDMSTPWSIATAPAWRWLYEPWPYPVSQDSTAVTNLAALRGDPVTEANRWEEDAWQLFAGAGPDVTDEDVRVVPLGVLLAVDESLALVATLAKGKGVWRKDGSDWHAWEAASR
jgi:Domain of unknown function (DUF4262)